MSLRTNTEDLIYCPERCFPSSFPYLGRKENTIFLTFHKGIIISFITWFPQIKSKHELLKLTCECSSIMQFSSVISCAIILIKRNDPGEIISNKTSLWCHTQRDYINQQYPGPVTIRQENHVITKCLISHVKG